jgi:hypothetical protein
VSAEHDSEPEDRLGMTEEQRVWFKAHTSGYDDQDVNGVDLSLLRRNLKLTPTERLQRHQGALRMVSEIERARRRARLLPLSESYGAVEPAWPAVE